MGASLFLFSLLAVSGIIHLIRFPHLILENGGGAFLILFFLALNFVALPLLITERVLDNKLQEIDIRSLINVRKGSRLGPTDRRFLFGWFGLRVCILLILFWLFLYLGSSAFIYVFFFMRTSLDIHSGFVDIPTVPELQFSLIGALFWTSLTFFVFLKWDDRWLKNFVRWVFPFCFLGLFVLLVKILFLVTDFSGLKDLFYPDFTSLTASSLSSVVGHSLLCLFIGLGFYRQHLVPKGNVDSIELYVRATIQCLAIAILVGVMALPMIEQVSETPFGSSWLFQILPRWLSYANFGLYYCGLFFICLCLICIYVTVSLLSVIDSNLILLFNLKQSTKVRWTVNALFVWGNAAMVVFLQNHLQGWSGQSLMISIDRFVVEVMFPLFALVTVWITFRYTKEHERFVVFNHQQIFFHSRPFFVIWQWVTVGFVPFLIILGWALQILD